MNKLPGAGTRLAEPAPDAAACACDPAFLAVPRTAATEMAAALLERGRKVVDLSAGFRLKEPPPMKPDTRSGTSDRIRCPKPSTACPSCTARPSPTS